MKPHIERAKRLVEELTTRKCPACKGTGGLTIQVLSTGGLPGMKTGPVGIKCVHCDGKGKMTPAQFAQYEAEKNFWCMCEEKPGEVPDVRYVPDNQPGAKCRKHHWVCNKCGKVTQVG